MRSHLINPKYPITGIDLGSVAIRVIIIDSKPSASLQGPGQQLHSCPAL